VDREKETDGKAGIVHYGTEVITDADRSISALLGASPGASVSGNIAFGVIKLCFSHLLDCPEGQARTKVMLPGYDEDLQLPAQTDRFREVNRQIDAVLQLAN
jgi:malate dehydrogenase (quinone)